MCGRCKQTSKNVKHFRVQLQMFTVKNGHFWFTKHVAK